MKIEKVLENARDLFSEGRNEEAFNIIEKGMKKFPHESSFPDLYSIKLFEMGNLQDSEKYADSAIKLGTVRSELYRIKAICLINSGGIKDVENFIETGIKFASNNVNEKRRLLNIYALSTIYLKEPNWEMKVLKIISDIQMMNPEDRDSLITLIYVNATMNNGENVTKYGEKLFKERNSDPISLYFLSEANLAVGDTKSALKYNKSLLEKIDGKNFDDYLALMQNYEILKRDGDPTPFFTMLTEFLIGNTENSRKMDFFQKILNMSSHKFQIFYTDERVPVLVELMGESDYGVIGEIFDYIFKNEFLDRCIALNERDSALYMFRAVSTFLEGDPEEGLLFIERSIKIDENWLNSLIKAVLMMQSSETTYDTAKEADGILEKWEKIDPSRAPIHQLRSILMSFALGEDGRKENEETRKSNPEDYNYMLTGVMINIAMHNFMGAIQIIDGYNDMGFIHTIRAFYQLSMLKAYCINGMGEQKTAVDFMTSLSMSLIGKEDYEEWADLIKGGEEFIPDTFYVENLPVYMFYPFTDPDPESLMMKVREEAI